MDVGSGDGAFEFYVRHTDSAGVYSCGGVLASRIEFVGVERG